VYALVKLTRKGAGSRLGHVLYGVCGSRRLLEKVCAGQERPEEWRVTGVGLDDLHQYAGIRRKAG